MIIFQSVINELDVNTNKDVYYLVTGNDKQVGFNLVGENVLAIRMKKAFGSSDSSFWLDDMYKANVMKFDSDIAYVKQFLKRGGVVVFSPSLLGEDLDNMETTCPKTAQYMKKKLGQLLNDKY